MSTPLAPPNPGAAPRRAAIAFVFVTVLLDMLAVGVIVPVLPRLVVLLEGGDTARAARAYGLFATVWALMQFVFSPMLGALSDRFGRRPVILLSNLGLGLDYVVMALAPTLGWLFLGRVISGVTSASVPAAGAYIADVTPPEKRAAGFGMLGAAFGIGFVLGPALGGLLGHRDPRLPFWVAAALSLANATYGFFVLPESLPRERRSGFSWRRANPVGSLVLLRSHRELTGISIALWLSYVAHEVLPSTFVLYAGYRYGWGTAAVGGTLALVGICFGGVQAGLVRPVVARYGERRALLVGLACGAVGFAAYGLAPVGWLLVAGVPLQSIWGLATPAAQGLMTRHVSPSEQGRLQGASGSLRGIAGLLGPGLFTQVFSRSIAPRAALPLPGGAFLVAASLLVAASAVGAWATRTR
ncbi:MAG: TCR/Tet family MFS transporter [Thermoanaerobaculia bacterium]